MGLYRRPSTLRHRALIGAALLAIAGCAGKPEPPDNAAICSAYSSGASGVEVIGRGSVLTVLGTSSGPSGPHEGFLLRLDGGCDLILRIEDNTGLTGPIPVHAGETVTVKGEYETDATGGVIHWTHRDPRGRHIGGYIVAAGKTYD
jgi:hypothetical protein